MLAETVREWTEPWVEQGIEQGIERGRVEVRALLRRQAARKFDAAGQQLAAALAEMTDPDRLAQVGDWIIECGTAAELFARLADTPPSRPVKARLLASGQPPSGLSRPPAAHAGDDHHVGWHAGHRRASAPLQRLEELRTMLAETAREWTEQWVEHGRAQGIEQGRVEERALLCRQAARKFGAAAGQQLAAALAEVTDLDRLAQVGDWIIECGTAAELFARLADTPPRGQ